jgi:hypothetical protein
MNSATSPKVGKSSLDNSNNFSIQENETAVRMIVVNDSDIVYPLSYEQQRQSLVEEKKPLV